ncbi:CoA-acylating methylmalonate-semialdehyde dehydrogenase [Kocuria marina]|uniref:methylmalonate-semialdehyde dehydrogenase (CoA acylating) n=1 Tax=Kocuria marina subsp. indica TaxID=1049583 RepID=A0A1X7CUS4_9MICC|nr:CoA-acylating methylmalonate-semialdehyde dehydrogenase [Kocuria indica]OXS83916.1 methylmalonate-semialdehyde dehydrogenase (CoA acylating) [Kocuria indica]RLP58202.1 methylmalonate-semialdehyde dehydrogenase (CoA acylating) [Kocuria indica]SMF03454.1 methylmalonate-semialdehyde dehydrogenase [acylating] [Kocuria indica]
MTQIPHFIAGTRVPGESGRFGEVYNPVQGTVAAQVPLATADEVERAVTSAQEAFPVWSALNPQRRGRLLLKWVDRINENADELAELLSNEHGKTLEDARGDIQRGVEVVEFAAGAPHLLKGEFSANAGTGIDVHSVRQPLGVVAGITPFNFPAMIPLWKTGIALAAGNTFVLKPSERDPSVPVRLTELAVEAGMPEGVLNVVHGDKTAVDALIEDPRVKAMGFVGSSPIAQSIYVAAAQHNKRAQCFGGAKNHMVIMPDADLEQAADALMGAAYGSAGERCMAVSVAVPVGEATADRLVDLLRERIDQLTLGPSLDPASDFGPVVGPDAKERIERYIGIGEQEGATLLVDGRGAEVAGHPDGFWVGATLFDHVTPDMQIYKDEIFGPVLCVVRAEDYEEALRLPSEHEYGNGVAIFTRDGDTARDFTSRVDVGMVGVNVPIPVPIAYYTFGGWKASGFGDLNQHGTDGLKFYTKTKTVTTRWPSGAKEGSSFVMPAGS